MKYNWLNRLKTEDLKSVLFSVVALITGNFASTIVGFICTIVQGRYVTAEVLGYYKQFTILSGYLFVFQLGTYQALERLVPFFYGRGEEEEARKHAAVAYAWCCFVSIIIACIFAGLVIKSLCEKDFRAALCWASQMIVAVYTIISGVLASTYRSLKDFQKLAKANIVGSVATLISIPVFPFNPFWGVVLKSTLNAVAIIPLLINCPIKTRPRFCLNSFKQLLKQGIPIFTASYVTGTGLDTLRNTLVLKFLDIKGLGLWNFAYMLYTMVLVIPNSLVAVITPRIIRDYGQKSSISFLLKKYKKTVLIFGAFAMLMAVGGGGLLTVIIPWLLPNYVESLPIIIALLPCFVIKVFDIFYSMLLAINDMKGINVISVSSSIIQVLAIVIICILFRSEYAFPLALFLGMLSKTILILIRLLILGRREKQCLQRKLPL